MFSDEFPLLNMFHSMIAILLKVSTCIKWKTRKQASIQILGVYQNIKIF